MTKKKNQRSSTLVLMIKYMQVKQYFLFHFTLFGNKSFDRTERNTLSTGSVNRHILVDGSSCSLLNYKKHAARSSPDITSPCLPNKVAFFKCSSYDDYNSQLSQIAESANFPTPISSFPRKAQKFHSMTFPPAHLVLICCRSGLCSSS